MQQKEGRHHDATGRKNKLTLSKHIRQKTQPTLLIHAQAAQCNRDKDASRAAARRHTPSPPRHAAPNAATHKATGKQTEQIAA
jgi:hypothetical protein